MCRWLPQPDRGPLLELTASIPQQYNSQQAAKIEIAGGKEREVRRERGSRRETWREVEEARYSRNKGKRANVRNSMRQRNNEKERENQGNESVRNEQLKSLAGIRDA